MNNLENIIEKIKIAELDPSKIYFIQVECLYNLSAEQFGFMRKILLDEFNKYNITNICVATPADIKINFTTLGDKND